jgi:transporter family protein
MATWVVYALLAAVFAASVTLFAKAGLSQVDVVVATTVRACVMALLLIGVCVATGRSWLHPSFDRSGLLWIVACGVAGALSWLFYFLALNDGSASVVAALDRTSVVFVVLGAASWLGEQLTIRSLLGAALVVAGATLMAYKSG